MSSASEETTVGLHTHNESIWSALAAGAAASAVARAVTYPPDLLKAQLQVDGVAQIGRPVVTSTLQIAKQVAQAEGPAGFYRGFGAVLAGVVPATMVYYAAYESSKKFVPDAWGSFKGPAVGLLTQLAAGLAFTPVDIVKERMQVDWVSIVAPLYEATCKLFILLAAAGSGSSIQTTFSLRLIQQQLMTTATPALSR